MNTRESLIQTTAKYIQKSGFNGTGLSDILSDVGVPKGSLYHHFPNGKDELFACAVHHYKDYLSEIFLSSMKGKSTASQGLSAMIDKYSELLKKSNYTLGCPISIIALETSGKNEILTQACKEVMDYWVEKINSYLTYKGIISDEHAALDFLTRLEGALIVSRIYQNDKALKKLKSQIKEIIEE
ncbi:MAG: hypothetical protein RLZZ546_266 [Bacteroidota bacterium]|jgi:TetR/AcrR family transcriptional repressor of lmrAB and yxaGH operons